MVYLSTGILYILISVMLLRIELMLPKKRQIFSFKRLVLGKQKICEDHFRSKDFKIQGLTFCLGILTLLKHVLDLSRFLVSCCLLSIRLSFLSSVHFKGTVSPDIQASFLAWMGISTPGGELQLVKKVFRGSSDFNIILNILMR